MEQYDYVLFVGALLSIFLLIGATPIRYYKRSVKTPEDIKKSKTISWLMFVLGLVFFVVTLFLYFYLVQSEMI